MYAEISSAVASAKLALDIAKTANGLANYNDLVSAVSDVNTKLMQATAVALASQEKQMSLVGRVQELEKELVRLKDWEAEASNYETLQIARGLFAYVVKGNVQSMSSTQKLCSNCFHQQTKSFLQESRERTAPRDYNLTCHRCSAKDVFREYIDAC